MKNFGIGGSQLISCKDKWVVFRYLFKNGEGNGRDGPQENSEGNDGEKKVSKKSEEERRTLEDAENITSQTKRRVDIITLQNNGVNLPKGCEYVDGTLEDNKDFLQFEFMFKGNRFKFVLNKNNQTVNVYRVRDIGQQGFQYGFSNPDEFYNKFLDDIDYEQRKIA